MAFWLVKSEPGVYSYSDLEREKRTEWSGVHNALALRHLKGMLPGDELLFYHSGSERAVVAIAGVAGRPHPDPDDLRGSWSVVVRARRRLRGAVALAELKSDPQLAGFLLFRMSRLSVLPVTPGQWTRVLAHEPGPARAPIASGQGNTRGSRSSQRVAAARKRGAT